MTRDREIFEAFQAMLEGQAPSGAEDRRMLSLARSLRRTGAATMEPAPDFQAVLRRRIIIEAERAARLPWRERVAAAVAQRNRAWLRSFRVVTATGLAALMVVVTGSMFALAANAKPGDWNYGIKRAQEAVRLAVTRGAVPRGYLELSFARTRLNEVGALAKAHVREEVLYTDTLGDMNASELNATELLVGASRLGAGVAPLHRLSRFADAQRVRLLALIDALPAGARPAARASVDVLAKVTDRVASVIAGCTCPANPLEVPQAALRPLPARGGDGVGCSCSGSPNQSSTTQNHSDGQQPDGSNPQAEPRPSQTPAPGSSLTDPVNGAINGVFGQIGQPSPTTLPTPLPTGTLLPTPLPTPSGLPQLP